VAAVGDRVSAHGLLSPIHPEILQQRRIG
jgi:hypothetical protein